MRYLVVGYGRVAVDCVNSDNDFYEEDEDPKELVRLFDAGEQGVTAPPTEVLGDADDPGGHTVPTQSGVDRADRSRDELIDVPMHVELDAMEAGILDPGTFTRRLGVDLKNPVLDDYEPDHKWRARAALLARNRAVALYCLRKGIQVDDGNRA